MSALDEFTAYAVAGIGTVGTDVFKGILPDSPPTCVSITPYSGSDRDEFGGVAIETRRYQVFVRGATYAAAEAKAEAIYARLRFVANVALPIAPATPTGWYLSIRCLQQPYFLDRDTNGNVTLAFNVETERTPL